MGRPNEIVFCSRDISIAVAFLTANRSNRSEMQSFGVFYSPPSAWEPIAYRMCTLYIRKCNFRVGRPGDTNFSRVLRICLCLRKCVHLCSETALVIVVCLPGTVRLVVSGD